jgi:two-component system cell cycle sensor histidine kinase/response regulator CckA
MLGLFKKKHLSKDVSRLVQDVLEGSRGARLIIDKDEKTIYTNQKFELLCNDKTDDTSSLTALSSLFDDKDTTLDHLRRIATIARQGEMETIELSSGMGAAETWFQITAQPITGRDDYVHIRIDDVTDRHLIDRAIREEREKLIDFTDNAPVGFFSVDENGRFVFVNATLARWLGEGIETLLSRGYLHNYFAEIPDDAAPYDIIEGGGAKQVGEVVMKGPGGRTFTASISQAVVQENEGRVRTRGVLHDLTAEREMYRALKVSQDRFQNFFEEAPLGVAIVDSDNKLSVCNPQMATMTGKSLATLQGIDLADLFYKEDQKSAMDRLLKLEKQDMSIAPMDVTLAGEGDDIPVQMFARRLDNDDTMMLQFIDMSEQKSLEAQFAQSQKMQAIGQLAGGVAHDFNNLLTAMIGFCDLLLLRHKPSDPSFSDIMQIKQNANRAANLVRQLLAFSRQQTLRPKVHDMTDILSEIGHLLRRLIGANIELSFSHGDDLGLVKVDETQIEQVLINLAVNARDAMDEKGDGNGSLTIKTENVTNKKPKETANDTMPVGKWVAITVSDTGCGISQENLDRIFEPFFTTKDVGQGTGLGLATVYGIIRQTGGFLDVDSKEGQGTSFTIYLPRVSDDQQEDADDVDGGEEEEIFDLTGTARILLIEDEDAVRTFSSRALANKGYQVTEANGGESALAILEEQGVDAFDLVITDVMMPDMDGPTIAGHFREKNPLLKLIYISGYTEERLKDHMGENIWFLAKPFTLKDLAAKVKEALDDKA